MKEVAKELVKIAKLLKSDENKIIGKNMRLTWKLFSIFLEELPQKGKKRLRKFNVRIWEPVLSNWNMHQFIPDNLIEYGINKITTADDYDSAKKKLEKKIEEAKVEAKQKYPDKDVTHWADGYEDTVSYLKVQPEGNEPLLLEGKDFKVKSTWTSFEAYSPESDFQSHDPFYTGIEQSSVTDARKLYKLLSANPELIKNMGYGDFTDFLDKKGIKVKHIHSVWH